MKHACKARTRAATRHATSNGLVLLMLVVLGLGAVASQPAAAPAQESVVTPAPLVEGDHSLASPDPTPTILVPPGAELVPSADLVPPADLEPPADPPPANAVAPSADPGPDPAPRTDPEPEPREAQSTDAGGGAPASTTSAQRTTAESPPVRAAQSAPSSVLLGTADAFAVLGGSAVTNTGPSVISGDVGVAPECAVSGFPPGIVVDGTIRRCDAVAAQAQADLTTAYNDAADRITTEQVATQLGGQTLTAGVYDSASGTFQITGTLTLDGQGNPDAVFILQTASTLITASASRVVLINGAQACNVFWQIGSSATLGTNSTFAGNVLALTSITATTGATVDGRLLARSGAVTLDTNTVTRSQCAIAVAVPDPDEPTDGADSGGDDAPGDTSTPGDGDGTPGETPGETPGGTGTPGDGGDTGDGTPGDDDATDGDPDAGTPGDDTPGRGDTTGRGTGGGTSAPPGGGDTTTSVTTGGPPGGGQTTDRFGDTAVSSSQDQGALPFTGLSLGFVALAGGVMVLLGAGLRRGQ